MQSPQYKYWSFVVMYEIPRPVILETVILAYARNHHFLSGIGEGIHHFSFVSLRMGLGFLSSSLVEGFCVYCIYDKFLLANALVYAKNSFGIL